MEKLKTYLLLCDCGICEHQLILQYDKNAEPLDKFLYVEVHLTHWENFFRRIGAAIKYIFNYKSRYGEFDEILVHPEEAKLLVRYLNEFIGEQK